MSAVDLWARHLVDVPLEADDRAELRAALAANDDFRTEAVRDLSFDRLLRARHRATQDAEAFERALFRTLEAERDATRFLRRVNARLQAGGDRRLPALVALAALVGLALLVSVPRPPRAPASDVPAGSVTVTPPTVALPERREPVAAPDVADRPEEPAKPDDTAAAREELERRLADARERDRKALDDLLRRSQDGPSPATQPSIGAIELAAGDAFVRTRRGRGVATAGGALSEGDAVQTGAGSARVLFADGTRAELDARSELRIDRGRIAVLAGVVTLRAPGRIVVAAPNGETTASGAALRFEIARASTRLDVIEGSARFGAVDVPGGHFALAAGKREPVVRLREPDAFTYGCVQAADASSSLPIGRVAIRFRAAHTAAVPEARLLFGGASSCSGGGVRVELREGARVLAAANVRQPRAPSARPVVFDPAPAVEAGRFYELVLTNPDPNPRDNWVSLRTLAGGRSEFAIPEAPGHVPAMEITYRSPHGRAVAGQPYAEVSRAVTIQGAQRVRETLTPRADVTVTSVSVRAGLRVRLEDAACALIEEGLVDASGTLAFASPRTLRAGQTYHLVLSALAGDRFEIAALASAAGFKSPALFVDGHAQVTSGASWEDLERRMDFDWPVRFGVAPR